MVEPVYHWTTVENAGKILREGLRKHSFVCRDFTGWKGEVCLEIEGVEIDWENRDPHATWQAITQEHIPPNRIRVKFFPEADRRGKCAHLKDEWVQGMKGKYNPDGYTKSGFYFWWVCGLCGEFMEGELPPKEVMEQEEVFVGFPGNWVDPIQKTESDEQE